MTGSGSDVNDTEQTYKHIGMFYRKTTARSKASKFTSTPPPGQTFACKPSGVHQVRSMACCVHLFRNKCVDSEESDLIAGYIPNMLAD
jgi:hypothetical protein